VAEALHLWLPRVIQAAKPWISSEDIEKGTRWGTEIAGELEDSNVGIVCVTSDNIRSPWLNFEAGALSKAISVARVCPYLLDVAPSDLEGPLTLFQLTRATKNDTEKLVCSINGWLEDAVPEANLKAQFDLLWGDLEKKFRSVPSTTESLPQRPEREILEEILETVRDLGRSRSVATSTTTVTDLPTGSVLPTHSALTRAPQSTHGQPDGSVPSG